MQLILISGRAGVGKTTLAKLIAERVFDLGFIPKLVSFAGSLKNMAKEKGYDKEEHPEKYRKFCQEYGAMMREEDPDYWVKMFSKGLRKETEEELKDVAAKKKYWERCIIVDDCRYMNEIAVGMEYKATIIFLTYGNRRINNVDDEWRKHHSEDLANKVENDEENYRDIFAHIISNGETIEKLQEKIAPMIPIWCGINPPETGQCQCEGCRAKREGRMANLDQCVKEMIDLLFMFDDDDDKEGDEET